jgi:enamine deaminase RidA (YjgF/YER057c/UK114 family)
MPLTDALARLGLDLPPAPAPLATYQPALFDEPAGLVYVSGQVPMKDGSPLASGRVPDGVDLDTARACARQCALNGLAAAAGAVGGPDRLARVIRVAGFVACTPEFTDQPKVIDGASALLTELMGEAGKHARAAVGVASLPLGVPVEIEFVFRVAD